MYCFFRKAVTAIVLLSSIAAHAQSSSWVKLASSANGEYTSYLDSSLEAIKQVEKNGWEVWVKMEYNTPQRDSIISFSYKSEQRRYLVRCDDRTMATIARNKFNDSGSPVSQEAWPESKWTFGPVGPKGGTNSTEFDAICTLTLFTNKVLDFSDRGNWFQAGIAASDSIDNSSVQRMGDLYAVRMRFVRQQDVRIGNNFYRTAYSYELGNCKNGTSGAYAYGFVNKQDQIVESGLVSAENIKMEPVNANSAVGAVHKVICGQPVASAPKPVQGATREKPVEASKDSTGTGFFVSGEGHVLTNNHVAGSCKAIAVRTSAREIFPARLIGADQRNDLAVLKIDKRIADFAVFRPVPPDIGEQVYAFGYPLSGVLSSGGNASNGIVSALAGMGDDTSKIQISAPVQPGNSGGPLYDKNGYVIGVIVEKIDALMVAKAIGDVPQNVNFAIKQNTATAFLDSLKLKYSIGKTTSPMEPIAIFTRARNQSVYIECYQ
jgi:S1-C subfamily serine protease